MKRILSAITLIAVSLILADCGGGGGSSSPAAVSQFPVAAAMSSFAQASHSFTLSATIGSNTETLQASFTLGAASTFGGQSASTLNQSVVISVNGVAGAALTTTSYFSTNPFKKLGGVVTSGSLSRQYTVYANQQTLPTNATVGQSGSFDSYTAYTDSTMSTVYATGTDQWSLSTDTASTAWLCNIDTETIVGSAATPITNCYQIDASGNVLSQTVTFIINGSAVTFK